MSNELCAFSAPAVPQQPRLGAGAHGRVLFEGDHPAEPHCNDPQQEEPVTMLMNVLLVDDSPSFLKVAHELIAALPCVAAVACADSGAQALDFIGRARFDLVLTDIAMPDMSGFAMIRHLRALDDPPQVVAVTLHEGAEYRAAVLRAGAEAMISKRLFVREAPTVIAAMGMACASGA